MVLKSKYLGNITAILLLVFIFQYVSTCHIYHTVGAYVTHADSGLHFIKLAFL